MSVSPNDFEAQASACLQQAVTLRPELIRYARKLTNGDEQQAHELVQESTLAVHEHVQRRGFSEGPQQLKAYLFVVMRNQHAQALRTAGRYVSLSGEPNAGGPAAEREKGGAEHPALQRHQQQQAEEEADATAVGVLGAAAALALASSFPLADRVLFRLSAEGYSSRQLEAMTGRPNRTIAWTLDRMRTQLQQMLRPLLGEL
jgi:RNA polymerase sigma factor (sigma-70 family)